LELVVQCVDKTLTKQRPPTSTTPERQGCLSGCSLLRACPAQTGAPNCRTPRERHNQSSAGGPFSPRAACCAVGGHCGRAVQPVVRACDPDALRSRPACALEDTRSSAGYPAFSNVSVCLTEIASIPPTNTSAMVTTATPAQVAGEACTVNAALLPAWRSTLQQLPGIVSWQRAGWLDGLSQWYPTME